MDQQSCYNNYSGKTKGVGQVVPIHFALLPEIGPVVPKMFSSKWKTALLSSFDRLVLPYNIILNWDHNVVVLSKQMQD